MNLSARSKSRQKTFFLFATLLGKRSQCSPQGIHAIGRQKQLGPTNNVDMQTAGNSRSMDRFSSISEESVQGNYRLLQGLSSRLPDIQVAECFDATKYFSWKDSNGINLYKTYYNCSCTGDLKSRFTMVCSLENYCGDIDANNNNKESDTTEKQCINRIYTYDFLVDSMGTIDKLESGRDCTEYLTGGGPKSGPLCRNISAVCILLLIHVHDYKIHESRKICDEPRTCRDTLPKIGYDEDRVNDLCPNTTLNNEECQSPGWESCGEYDNENKMFFTKTPDCSNIEPCAKSLCLSHPKFDESPYRFLRQFPQCPDETPFAVSSEVPSLGYSATISFQVILLNLLLYYL